MDSVLNVATPATAATVAVPHKLPPPGFIPIPTVTRDVSVVTVFPLASCTSTLTGGLIFAPATVLAGCGPKASWVAGPATVRGALVLGALLVSVLSVAVTVAIPAVLSVTLNVWVPFTKAAGAGNAALESLDVIPTVSAT